MRSLQLIAIIAVLSATTLSAQSFNFTGFTGATPVTLNGQAGPAGGAARISPAVLSSKGSLFHQSQFSVEYGFDLSFDFKISVPPAGAGGGDGLALVIHNDPRADTFLGNHAGQMGYGAFLTSAVGTGITNALVVEIDTFQGSFNGSSDISGNEISIHTNGTGEVSSDEALSIGRVAVVPNMSDGSTHTLRVLYVPGTIQIFLDGSVTPILTTPYSFSSGGTHILPGTPVGGMTLASGAAWLGFTASCGASYEDHDVSAWSFASAIPPTYPGNQTDFDCEITIAGNLQNEGSRVYSANTLDTVQLRYFSPDGGTDGQFFSSFFQLMLTGTTLFSQVIPGEPAPGGFWLDTTSAIPGVLSGVFPFIDGIGFGSATFLAPFLPATGYNYGFVIPLVLTGQGSSLMLQAVIVEPGLNGANLGIGHAIELQVN